MTWLDEIRAQRVQQVATVLGLSCAKNTISPCPACGATQRGSHDRRGPVGVNSSGVGWRCHRCGAGGDAVSLAACVVTGSTSPLPAQWESIRAACVGRLCTGTGSVTALRSIPAPVADAPPMRAPAAELSAVWGTARQAHQDNVVVRWLREIRLIDPGAVDGLCRASVRPSWFNWCRYWHRAGYRLLVPLVDHRGVMRGLRARRVHLPGHPHTDGRPKAVAPTGCDLRGLVMADPSTTLAMQVCAPVLSLVITEGEMDFFCATGPRWNTIGIVEGAWTTELAKWASRAGRVLIATDHDSKGQAYAAKIGATLSGPEVIRWPRPSTGKDVNDAIISGEGFSWPR